MQCSHETGRAFAVMFFGVASAYRVFLDLFDEQDGLRCLYNSISVLKILQVDDEAGSLMTDDEEATQKQVKLNFFAHNILPHQLSTFIPTGPATSHGVLSKVLRVSPHHTLRAALQDPRPLAAVEQLLVFVLVVLVVLCGHSILVREVAPQSVEAGPAGQHLGHDRRRGQADAVQGEVDAGRQV